MKLIPLIGFKGIFGHRQKKKEKKKKGEEGCAATAAEEDGTHSPNRVAAGEGATSPRRKWTRWTSWRNEEKTEEDTDNRQSPFSLRLLLFSRLFFPLDAAVRPCFFALQCLVPPMIVLLFCCGFAAKCVSSYPRCDGERKRFGYKMILEWIRKSKSQPWLFKCFQSWGETETDWNSILSRPRRYFYLVLPFIFDIYWCIKDAKNWNTSAADRPE